MLSTLMSKFYMDIRLSRIRILKTNKNPRGACGLGRNQMLGKGKYAIFHITCGMSSMHKYSGQAVMSL